MKGRIHSIESFGTLDGPGLRYVVFFAGCPMRCLYCHNPDTWTGEGTLYTAEELLAPMERTRPFYRSGGLTATGGEPMAQLAFLTELFSLAKERGIHTCLDTSGITYREANPAFSDLLRVTDLVMLDIKHTDPEGHLSLTGQPSDAPLAFLSRLCREGIPVRLRHVLVPGITYDTDEILALKRLADGLSNLESVELLPYHTLGKAKYARLGIPYPLGNTPPLTEEELHRAEDLLTGKIEKL